MTTRTCLILSAVAGAAAVAAGTFGAHGLDGRVTPDRLATYEVGVRYHAYHALALLGLAAHVPALGRLGAAAGWCFFVGLAIFASTLYALVVLDQPWLGAVTPVGGTLLVAGWGLLGIAAWRKLPA